jgi:hypothetical protein
MRKFWKAILRSAERSGEARAKACLIQMGYTPEVIARERAKFHTLWD